MTLPCFVHNGSKTASGGSFPTLGNELIISGADIIGKSFTSSPNLSAGVSPFGLTRRWAAAAAAAAATVAAAQSVLRLCITVTTCISTHH